MNYTKIYYLNNITWLGLAITAVVWGYSIENGKKICRLCYLPIEIFTDTATKFESFDISLAGENKWKLCRNM